MGGPLVSKSPLADAVYPAPDHLTDAEAAALPLAGLTAWRALCTRGEVKSGSQVLITGIGGGVSSIAAQFAIAAGAEVTVTLKLRQEIKSSSRNGLHQRTRSSVRYLSKSTENEIQEYIRSDRRSWR